MSNENDDNKHLWMEALAAVDMRLTLDDWAVCSNLQKTFLDSATQLSDLDVVWASVYGYTPSIVRELIQCRRSEDVADVAMLLGRLRYTFLALLDKPQHRYQVRAAAALLVDAADVFRAYRQKGYVRTHAKIMEEEAGIGSDVAAAHAYFLHASDPTPSVIAAGARTEKMRDAIEICRSSPADADHLGMPDVFLGVDASGKLVLLDASRGASVINIGSRVPHNWVVRVSPYANHFLAGDTSCCVMVKLNETLTSAIENPVVLPRYPHARAYGVDNTWVVWAGVNNAPRALRWDVQTESAALCDVEEAALHAATTQSVYSRGNSVWRNDTCIACLPPSESISAIIGTSIGFDAFTQNKDWWRVDVRARKAWVVGLPTADIVCTVAPLVEWSGLT